MRTGGGSCVCVIRRPSFSRSEVFFERLLFLCCYCYGQLLIDKRCLLPKSGDSSFCPLFFCIPTMIDSAMLLSRPRTSELSKVLYLTHTAPGYFFFPFLPPPQTGVPVKCIMSPETFSSSNLSILIHRGLLPHHLKSYFTS